LASADDGAKGQRWYDWAWIAVSNPGPGCRHLLIRRNRATGELAFYRCYSRQPVTLAALVTVAGLRWTIEENFQAGKGLTALEGEMDGHLGYSRHDRADGVVGHLSADRAHHQPGEATGAARADHQQLGVLRLPDENRVRARRDKPALSLTEAPRRRARPQPWPPLPERRPGAAIRYCSSLETTIMPSRGWCSPGP
jgi:hypothetical protein